MLTGATIEVSSTPLPRAVRFTSGGGGGEGEAAGSVSAASSLGTEERRVSSWQQQQQKFASAAAEKKEKKPVYVYQQEEPALSKGTCAAAAGLERDNNSRDGGWEDDAAVTAAAAAAAPAAPAAADRSWRASYASSLYCLLPTWLLRFRRTGYSPLRDGSCGAAASSSSAPAASCSGSNSAAAAGGGSAAPGADAPCFGDAPFSTVCLHCHKAIITTVAFKISCIGICLCVLSPLLLGWPGLCLSPFLYIALKDAVHTCPQCRNLIHRQSRVSVPFCGLRDEVVTVKCGSCAVVLSRRYLLLFTALLLLILLFYVLRAGWLGSSLDVIPKGPPTTLSWQQFYEQCGQRSQLGNSLKAGANFRDSFAGKTVEWKGLVKQVKEGFFSSNVLYLIMSPTITVSGGSQSTPPGEGDFDGKSSPDRTSVSADDRNRENEEGMGSFAKNSAAHEEGTAAKKGEDGGNVTHGSGLAEDEDLEEEARALQGDGADLALAFNGRELAAKVEKLEPGDKVEFQATLVSLGRRGKPSLGRLWDVTLVEKREVRQARLEEWRAKKAERQHLLHRLLLPIIGGPFSDFGGFDPFGSLFSSTGGLGGSGVMVIRRQIISPTATFSVISSSAGDEPGPTITSSFEGGGSISLVGTHGGHETDEEKRRSDSISSGAGHVDVADLFAGLGGVRHGSAAGKHHEAVDKFGGEHISDDGSFVLHVDDEPEEDHIRGVLGGGSKFGHQQVNSRSGGMPVWSGNIVDDDEDMQWNDIPAERHGSNGLYFRVKDDEEDVQDDSFAGRDAAEEPRGAATPASSPAAASQHEGKKQQQPHPHAGVAGVEEGGEDSTLRALKAAVELQRQRRAQQEEKANEQGPWQRWQTQQERHQQAPYGQQHHQQQKQQQEDPVEKGWGKSTAEASGRSAAETSHDRPQPLQDAPWMHGDEAYNARTDAIVEGAQPDHDPYAEVADVHTEHEQPKQMHGTQKQQPTVAYTGGTAAEGGAASVQHDQQEPGATANGTPSKVSAGDSGTTQP